MWEVPRDTNARTLIQGMYSSLTPLAIAGGYPFIYLSLCKTTFERTGLQGDNLTWLIWLTGLPE